MEQVEVFFSSLYGTVIVGAIGSLLGVFILSVFKYFRGKFFPKFREETQSNRLFVQKIIKSGNKSDALFILTFSIGMMIIYVILASLFLVVFLILKKHGAETIFHMPIILAFCFFCVWQTYLQSRSVFDMKRAMEKKYRKDDPKLNDD